MAEVLKIQAFPNGYVLENWWQYALVGIVAGSALIGVLAIVWAVTSALRKSSVRRRAKCWTVTLLTINSEAKKEVS